MAWAAVLLWFAVFGWFVRAGCIVMSTMRERRNRIRCMSNLSLIAKACNSHAENHDGLLPETLAALVPTYVNGPTVLACPTVLRAGSIPAPEPGGGTEPNAVCYCYVAGLKAGDSKDYILAFDEEWNHGGKGMNVLFVGSNVGWHRDIAAVHTQITKQKKELAAQGRTIRIIHPAWSRWPERPEYPVTPLRERPLVIALVVGSGIAIAAPAALLVVRRRRRARENRA
jgi:hypothetical protein